MATRTNKNGTKAKDKLTITKKGTWKAGAGNDTIYVKSSKAVTVYGEAGSDVIYVSAGSNHTVNVGVGNDTVKLNGGSIKSLKLVSGTNNVTVSKGTITTLTGGTGIDKINVKGGKVTTAKLGKGNDVIVVSKGTVKTVDLGTGNDSVTISGGQIASLKGNSGTNTINVKGGTVTTITGGKGKDTLNFGAGTITNWVNMGAGNDVVNIKGGIKLNVAGGSGNDIYAISSLPAKGIYVLDQTSAGKTDKDVLKLTQYNAKDFSFKIDQSGDLVISYVKGTTITVKDWQNHALATIELKDGSITANDINSFGKFNESTSEINYDVRSAEPTTSLSVIKSFMGSLDTTVQKGFAAVDEAVAACSYGLYGSLRELVNSFINDCLQYSGSSTATKKAFLKEYCGINLDNADTGSITGSDAGGKVTKNAEAIVKESVGMNGFTYNYNNFKTVKAVDLSGFVTGKSTSYSSTKDFYGVTVNGVTLYWDESNWGNLGININTVRQVVGGMINTWVKDGLNLIEESYGLSLNNENSTLQRLEDGTVGLQLYFTNSTRNTAIASINSSRYYVGNITTKTYELMNINLNYYTDGCGNENGISSKAGVGYLDRTIAHELTHAVMAANINSHGSLPVFIKEGMSELTHGIDDQRINSILTLVDTNYQNSTVGGLEGLLRKTFNLDSTSATNSTYTYAGGYMLLRYMAQQISKESSGADMSYSFGSLLTGAGVDSSVSYNLSEVMNQLQIAETNFTYNAVDFTSAVDSSIYSRNENLVFGNC